MNPVFWLLTLLILALAWWSMRSLFPKIGKSVTDKYDEMTKIIQSDMYKEIIRDGYISEETKRAFLEYYEQYIK